MKDTCTYLYSHTNALHGVSLTHTLSHTHKYTDPDPHPHPNTHTHTHTNIHTHTHTHAYARIHICTHTHTHISIHLFIDSLILDSLGTVVERRMRSKLLAIMGNVNHPLHHILAGQSSSLRSGRLNTLRSRTERHRRSFVPAAIKLKDRKGKRL